MFNIFRNTAFHSSVLGINERNVQYVYAKNRRRDFKLADDKIVCKEILHKHRLSCADTYGIIDKIGTIHKVWQSVENRHTLAIKPANGSGGGGILILKKSDQGIWTSGGTPWSDARIHAHMAQIIMGMYSFSSSDRVLIEQCIVPHPFFYEIYPAGVPDFRVILLDNVPVMSMLRVPTDRSDGKANLHQGGLGIGVDMELRTLTHAYDGQHYYDVHPDNGQLISGKEIPFWDKILSLSIATSKVFPLNYLGIDIVLDRDYGPMIMEINARPGLGIQIANRVGLKTILNKTKYAHHEI